MAYVAKAIMINEKKKIINKLNLHILNSNLLFYSKSASLNYTLCIQY